MALEDLPTGVSIDLVACLKRLNGNPQRGEWSSSAGWEGKRLSGFREPSQELCLGHWPRV